MWRWQMSTFYNINHGTKVETEKIYHLKGKIW